MARQKQPSVSMIKFGFLVLALPLSYYFVAGALPIAMLAMAALGVLFIWMQPFSVTIRQASMILATYLAIAGLLSFSQPFMVDSWGIFNWILLLSTIMQPVIFVLLLDAIMGMMQQNRRAFDMVAIILMWVATFAVTFGSTALLHGAEADLTGVFLLFLNPWLINGAVILSAALVLILSMPHRHVLRQKLAGKAKKKRAK